MFFLIVHLEAELMANNDKIRSFTMLLTKIPQKFQLKPRSLMKKITLLVYQIRSLITINAWKFTHVIFLSLSWRKNSTKLFLVCLFSTTRVKAFPDGKNWFFALISWMNPFSTCFSFSFFLKHLLKLSHHHYKFFISIFFHMHGKAPFTNTHSDWVWRITQKIPSWSQNCIFSSSWWFFTMIATNCFTSEWLQ